MKWNWKTNAIEMNLFNQYAWEYWNLDGENVWMHSECSICKFKKKFFKGPLNREIALKSYVKLH